MLEAGAHTPNMSQRIQDPKNNAARAFNTGIDDAERGEYRAPVESVIGAYHEGWQTVRRLPAQAR
jgi:hypothetical protein